VLGWATLDVAIKIWKTVIKARQTKSGKTVIPNSALQIAEKLCFGVAQRFQHRGYFNTIKPDPTHPSRIGLSRGYGITGESLFSSLLAAMQPVMLYPRKAVESL
jgi:hypothetical protein